jgi:hypothetical protein
MPLISKVAVLGILIAAAACAAAPSSADSNTRRVVSTLGFSFLPPMGSDWKEQFESQQITYLKRTDPAKASFYMGALEGKLRSKLATTEELVAFVRAKKDQWGTEGRYSEPETSFAVEDGDKSCVRYRMKGNDRNAKNKGEHDFLVVLAVGRFCVHPKDRSNAVDIYYSARYAPTFDPKALIADGETFVQSLRIQEVR